MATAQGQINALRGELDHAQRLATLGTLASMIAHEFNNALTPVISYAQMALAAPDDRELATKALERTLLNAERVSKIANSILGFARPGVPEEGVPERHGEVISGVSTVSQLVSQNPCSTWNNEEKGFERSFHASSPGFAEAAACIHVVLNEALGCLARELESDGIRLEVDVPKFLAAGIEASALQHVILNLVLNARTAMVGRDGIGATNLQAPDRSANQPLRRRHVLRIAAGAVDPNAKSRFSEYPDSAYIAIGPSGVCSTRASGEARGPSKSESARQVVMYIDDTGEGMSQQQLLKLFTPFALSAPEVGPGNQPKDKQRAKCRRGTGLGMAICARLVNGVGGQVIVESARTIGTRISIVLPMAG